MIDAWISLPIAVRYGLLAVLGLLMGAVANHLIYRRCYFPRPIGPWGPADEKAGPRRWMDYVPVLGWLALRRQVSVHGKGFWIRPLLIEVALAVSLPLLYDWYVVSGMLVPEEWRAPASLARLEALMSGIYAFHLILLLLMVAATFIDFDEYTIPDILTVPGTIIALVCAAIWWELFIPVVYVSFPDGTPKTVALTWFTLPYAPDPSWWSARGLRVAMGIWTMWCFALSNRRVILRHGWLKAVAYFMASLVRRSAWKRLLGIWVAGLIGISYVYSLGPGNLHWLGLLNSLIGLAVGGGIVWLIRIVGSLSLRKEAMGFGDVTLMAMIGAFIGWQGATMAFFLSPFAALLVVLVHLVLVGNKPLPFGPYLCVATLLTILAWPIMVGEWFIPTLGVMASLLIWLFLALLGMMGVMLFFYRLIGDALYARHTQQSEHE